jgi:protein AATF/BFR2
LKGEDDSDSSESIDGEASDSEPEAALQFADIEDVDLDVDEEDGDIDSDAAFGESDSEKFKDFKFRGSSMPRLVNGVNRRPTAADFMSDSDNGEGVRDRDDSDVEESDEDLLDADEQHAEEGGDEELSQGPSAEEEDEDEHQSLHSSQASGAEQGEDDEDDSEESDKEQIDDEDDNKTARDEVRKIMNEEQKTVVATISQAAKADATKGIAVKQQRKAFDSLLSIRMVLQKSLIATNSIVAVDDKDSEESSDEPYLGAEDAAIKLWNTLDCLRHELIKANSTSKSSHKRKRDVNSSTPSAEIWERMQGSEVASIDVRQRTLEKWWDKARGSAAPLAGKLNNNVVRMSLTSAIQEQLAKPETLQKTKRARSCAPVQEKLKITEDPDIYDDTTLYKTLLNQLVEQRKMDSGPAAGGDGTPAQWVVKEAKMRKTVDTKASKGRKMRFTVQEKLQNFMAPEDRGSWEQQAVDRFFGTLLGQKMTLGEEDIEVDEENEVSLEEAGLMLFRS